MSGQVKVDLHVHTSVSLDSVLSFSDIRKIFDSGKVDKIAITDHNEIKGALELKKIHGDKIIIGEEMSTKDGHVIGLFLKKRIEKGLSALETAKQIKKQGGLVYIPHIYDEWRHGIGEKVARKIMKDVDIIEVFNSRASHEGNEKSGELAKEFTKGNASSSDAHDKRTVGKSHTILMDFNSAKSLLSSLKDARFVKKTASLAIFSPMLIKFVRKAFRR